MSNTRLVFPVVNLNGDKAQTLKDQLERCFENLGDTLDAFYSARPHGRNYQLQESGTYKKASEQHEMWIQEIEKIKSDVYEMWQQIDQQ